MNILFVHEVDWFRKVVFDMHLLAEALSLRGHNVYAIDYEEPFLRWDGRSLRTKHIGGMSLALEGSKVEVITPGIVNIPGLRRLSATLTSYMAIGRMLDDKRIDAVILYSVATNGWQAIVQAQRRRIPVLFRSIDILHRLAPKRFGFAVRALEKYVYRRADMVLTMTPTLSDYVAKLGADRGKIRLLPIPVDTVIFRPSPVPESLRQQWGIDGTDKVILYMGTLFDFSGVRMLLNIMPELSRRAPGTKLLVVGDGPQRRELDMIIAAMGLGDRVSITGFQPYAMMPHYINMADVCVSPFRNTEATRDIFPGKVAQYLACGKAVVATPLPGIKAMLPGSCEGIIYAAGQSEMADSLIAVLQDAEYRRHLGSDGLEYARAVFGIESIVWKLESYLEEARAKANV